MNKTVIAAALTLSSSLALAAGTTTTDNPPTPNITPVPGAESPARTPEPVERDAVPGKERAVRAEPFATFDDNKDGLISGDEIKDIKNLDLAKVDRNHDGSISPAEFEAAGPFEKKSLLDKAREALGSTGDSDETRTTH